MVISPLLEPIYAATVFLANGSVRKFFQHMKVLGVLVVVLIIVSALVTACLAVFTTLPVTREDSLAAGISGSLRNSRYPSGYHRNLCPQERICHSSNRGRDFGRPGSPGCRNGNNHSPAARTDFRCSRTLTEQHTRALRRMLIAILVLGIGPRGTVNLKLTRTNVYLMGISVAGLLLVVFILLRILRQGL